MNCFAHPPIPRRASQRGVSLLFTLMALVILAFGAVALTRTVDTGTLIMGNLSFRQDAVVASSSGAEVAIKWLRDNQSPAATLYKDDDDKGYSAASIDNLDPSGSRTSAGNKLAIVDWDGACMGLPATAYGSCIKPFKGADVNDNTVQWLITRLCAQEGAPVAPNVCSRPPAGSTGGAKDRSELNPGGRIVGGTASPYYRIIVRVQGPRNTVSTTETLVHF